MAEKKKPIYFFGNGKADGSAKMRELLGGKGAGLHEMTRIGIPVPPGFTITTEVCKYYYDHDRRYPKDLDVRINAALGRMEKILDRRFGDAETPLLVSVRSGARESMPGMMDTVLNLGLNDRTVRGLIRETNNPRFAFDAYRRFIQMYADVVLGIKRKNSFGADPLETILEHHKEARGTRFDTELDVADLEKLVTEYKAEIKKTLGQEFPEEPFEQLRGAIGAVFGSWNNDRAIKYR